MLEYRKARKEDAEEIIDFINYVFSAAHEPHDFKKRNPRMYDSDYPFWDDHYVAVADGRVKATLSVTERKAVCGGVTMRAGHVGQVSVHPYARGKGYMRELMRMAEADMRAAGFDFAELNGLRQRYEYFGYTQGGCVWEVAVTPDNARHAFSGRSTGIELRETESAGRYAVTRDGARLGEVSGGSLALSDYADAPETCALFFAREGAKPLRLYVAPYDSARLLGIAAFCESMLLKTTMQYNIFHFGRFLQAGLTARAALLRDGETRFVADGEPVCARVSGGAVSVSAEAEGAPALAKMRAQSLLLSPVSPVMFPDAPVGWFPITL